VKNIREHGRAQQKPNLVARHAWAQLIYHVLSDDIALLHVGMVWPQGVGEPG